MLKCFRFIAYKYKIEFISYFSSYYYWLFTFQNIINYSYYLN